MRIGKSIQNGNFHKIILIIAKCGFEIIFLKNIIKKYCKIFIYQ